MQLSEIERSIVIALHSYTLAKNQSGTPPEALTWSELLELAAEVKAEMEIAIPKEEQR